MCLCVHVCVCVCVCWCVWAHSLCAWVNMIWGHSFLRKSFVVWLGKKSNVQHFKLSLAGEKLNFLEKLTYHREIWAWNEVLYFSFLSPNPLNLWDQNLKKENVIVHIYIYICLEKLCFICNRKNSLCFICIFHAQSIHICMYTYAYTWYIHYIFMPI